MANPHDSNRYYVPEQSYLPILSAIGLLILGIGAASTIHRNTIGPYFLVGGLLITLAIMFVWFATVSREGLQNLYNNQMDRSFRWSMQWFIFSEVMFFAAFFGALFYIRWLAVPWLSGGGHHGATQTLLWPEFIRQWPLLNNPNPALYQGPEAAMPWQGIPLINTLILISSSVTVTWAHHALKANHRGQLILGLIATVLLGVVFIGAQAYEYYEAYHHYGITLDSGAYGTTFFLLTGFHGLHVTIGTLALFFIMLRCIRGHFNSEKHFGFEATAWYWHFVDVVWVVLFIVVYLF